LQPGGGAFLLVMRFYLILVPEALGNGAETLENRAC